MKHKRYEISFHNRLITVYVDGHYSHEISFAAAINYQRDIVRKLLASLDRSRFEMVAPTDDGAWVYEGWGV